MGGLLLWLFILFPMAEVYVLIKVGSRLGFFNTLFIVIVSALLGSHFAKVQGRMALQKIQTCLLEGRMPTIEMVDGLLIFLGGVLFAFPGFISDILGFILLFPLTRWLVRALVLATMQNSIRSKTAGTSRPPHSSSAGKRAFGRPGAEDAQIIE